MPHSQAHFHLLFPADGSNVHLCKALLSATLLNYPTPTLYNWQGSSSMMAKITGGLAYLERLYSDRDKDLVLIVDGFDLWFQLSPQILVDRYHAINAAAEKRIRNQTGQEAMEQGHIAQKIIFAAQKRCWPGAADHVSCTAVPESQLPMDIYGPDTDIPSGDEKNPYLRIRQRFLNAGFVMGPVKEMRALFERAQEKADADPEQYGQDQSVFASIWGEQEKQRSTLKDAVASASAGKTSPLKRDFLSSREIDYEFGIGLDYESALSMPTVFSEYDSQWVTFSNETTIKMANKEDQITHPRAKELQTDIAADKLPFYMLAGAAPHTEPKLWLHGSSSTKWEHVPLYTNLWTGITPAIIHHNAHRDNLKSLRETTWDRMWFQPFARTLLDAKMAQPAGPLTVDKSGTRWLSSVADGTVQENGYGAQTDDGRGHKGWQRWGELCTAEDQEEIFRDGKGEWGLG